MGSGRWKQQLGLGAHDQPSLISKHLSPAIADRTGGLNSRTPQVQAQATEGSGGSLRRRRRHFQKLSLAGMLAGDDDGCVATNGGGVSDEAHNWRGGDRAEAEAEAHGLPAHMEERVLSRGRGRVG